MLKTLIACLFVPQILLAQRVEVPSSTEEKTETAAPENGERTRRGLGRQARERSMDGGNERVSSQRTVLIGFGPAQFTNMNSSQTGLDFNLGYNWSVNDHFDLGLQSEFALSTEPVKAHMLVGKIVTNYYFLAEDISPFIGAGFGYGWAQARRLGLSDASAAGFAFSAQAGVKFFRTSDVNLAVTLAYNTVFDQNSLGQPGMMALQVGLFY